MYEENKSRLVIITPIYKTFLTVSELTRLKYSLNVNCEYKHIFIHPNKLELSYYKTNFKNSEFEGFENKYFDGIQGYNQLMQLDEFYYRFFRGYKYLAILQTDAVLLANLNNVNFENYDYIGSSWAENFKVNSYLLRNKKSIFNRIMYKIMKKTYLNVGNGGLSIRKIQSFLFITSILKYWNYKFEPEDVALSYALKNFGFNIIKKETVDTIFGEAIVKKMNMNEITNLVGVHGIDKVAPATDRLILDYINQL